MSPLAALQLVSFTCADYTFMIKKKKLKKLIQFAGHTDISKTEMLLSTRSSARMLSVVYKKKKTIPRVQLISSTKRVTQYNIVYIIDNRGSV